MRSLEGRLHLGLSIGLIVLIGCAWWLGRHTLHSGAESLILSRLRQDAEALVGAFTLDADGSSSLRGHRLTPVYDQPYSGHYFALRTDEGKLLFSRSLWDRNLEVRPLAPGEIANWRAEGPDGQRLLVWASGYRRYGRAFSLAVAQDVTPLEQSVEAVERRFGFLAAVGLVLILLVQHLVVFRAFQRLRPVYRDIDRLETGETTFLTEEVPTEFLPLVRKINRLLELFVKRLERSRNAAGNLAHALKGPLNLMLQELDRSDCTIDSGARDRLRDEVQQVLGRMERELKRARLAGEGAVGRRFEPEEELPSLIRLLERMYADKWVDIEYRIATQSPLAADREDMLELLGILMENACKWARTRVLCTIEPRNGDMLIRVEDDGPGCAGEELETVLARGVRLDERVSGHGLGLAIASDIADTYGGRIELGRSEVLGGFRALLILPVGRSGRE